MYIDTVPNRTSPPAILLRESVRQDGKVHKRTLANLSHWPAERIETLRRALKGEKLVSPGECMQIERSLPHGHVAAVLGTMRRLGVAEMIDAKASRRRNVVSAMIVARVLDPRSKLATARALDEQTAGDSLGAALGFANLDEDDLYEAMDWLLPRQSQIEEQLARRHLGAGSVVLYDLTSTYFEGRHCPLARLGHSGDERSANPQIVIGLMTNGEGCPVAVEVFEGNTADPATVEKQISKLRERFHLQQLIVVGDRGTLTSARIRENLQTAEQMQWITALRAPQIAALVNSQALQLSLFDDRDVAGIEHPDYPGERLIACRNPLLAAERRRKRNELLEVTEQRLQKVVAAVQREKRPLRGKERIALAAGKALGRYKMGKHFHLHITDNAFPVERRQKEIDAEAALDGIYVIRTNVPAETMSGSKAVETYKGLSAVEQAFRSLKSVDLKVRPIHHRLADRVKAHVLLCMLAWYVEWHLRKQLAPVLFEDADPAAGRTLRNSVVAPARRSAEAQAKARRKRTAAGLPVHSFRTLLSDLQTIVRNRVLVNDSTFEMLTTPTPFQQHVFGLLGFLPQL